MFWPDNDDEGRIAMQKADALIKGDGKRYIIPAPSDAPEKWDIADSKWTSEEAFAYVKSSRQQLTPKSNIELVEIQPTKPRERKQSSNNLPGMPFRCLGFDRNIYFYLPDKACQVTSLTPSQHIKNYLITLAPLDIWADIYGKENEKAKFLLIGLVPLML